MYFCVPNHAILFRNFHSDPAKKGRPSEGVLQFTDTYTARDVAQHIDKGNQYIIDQVLFYKLKRIPNGATVSVYANCWEDGLARKVSNIGLTLIKDKNVVFSGQLKPISSKCSDENYQPLQVFAATVEFDDLNHPTSVIQFAVNRVSTVEDFQYQMRDSRFAQELWGSATNKDQTDVEFKVGGKIFPAHRALLAACCPALAALVPEEPSTVPIPIEGMDPDVFQVLLHFLYTGQIDAPRLNEAHLKAAEYFGIETLKLVAQASEWYKELDEDVLSEFIMSLV